MYVYVENLRRAEWRREGKEGGGDLGGFSCFFRAFGGEGTFGKGVRGVRSVLERQMRVN